jgi:heme-degrading monooxygenase HmoA
MYATRVDIMVAFGKAEAFEERANRQLDVIQTQPGFQARRLLNSLGCPAKYIQVTYWDSREAAREAVRSAATLSFLEANPPVEWATLVRPVEAYEEVHTIEGQSSAPGQAPAQVTLIDWTLNPGIENAEAFERSRKAIFEQHRQHNPGLLRHRLLRYLGGGGRYLVVNATTGREAMLAAFKHPEIQPVLAAHPASAYASTPPTMEVCEPVRVAVPA